MFDGNSCGVLSAIHEQSEDINKGVDKNDYDLQGAGDQGMMFGYATNETENYMPLALELSNRILKELSCLRRENREINYLRPDSKSQVTIEYSDKNVPLRIDSIVLSTQHDPFLSDDKAMLNKIKKDIKNILMPRVISKLPNNIQSLFNEKIKYHINPTGKFVIGGPHGDTGLTGRKIIVDTYGGKGAHGGGAFSGKDPSKVDRSGAYAMRHIAKNMVAAGICDEILVQVSYAIGLAEPTGLYVNTYGTSNLKVCDGEIAKKILTMVDLRPAAIEKRLKLRSPIYSETSAFGHMGRSNKFVEKSFKKPSGEEIKLNVELFTWEKLDLVSDIKSSFNL